MKEGTEQAVWQEALARVRALDAALAASADCGGALAETASWLAAQKALPRLAGLARLLVPGLTRRQLWCVLVPIERRVARLKVTDVEILEGDKDLSGSSQSRMPLTVVLDSLRSAFNVGGIFRTAECFGVKELLLCGYTALPDQPQVARAALGTETRVIWRALPDVRTAVRGLKAAGVPCFALETVPSAPDVAEFAWPFPCALLLGNERFGLEPDVMQLCDGTVRIPLYGTKNSLNVAASFAIAAHCIRKKYRQTEPEG